MRYTTFEELGIDSSALKCEPMPVPSEIPVPKLPAVQAVGGLTLADAKKALALTFGVPAEAIEITIRG